MALRLVALAALAILLTGGCVAKPTQIPRDPECERSLPVHVVIGVSGRGLPAATRRTILQGVTAQLAARAWSRHRLRPI
jgi:hypothetical protein